MNGTDPCPKCGLPMKTHGELRRNGMGILHNPCTFRDESELTTELIGFEGWRVLAITLEEGEDGNTVEVQHRFYVGKSTGWRPIHLEIARRDSMGGSPADKRYIMVERLYERIDRRGRVKP